FPKELIDPAIKGTLNVLKSCAKVRSIKRVVITASIGSVVYNEKPCTPDTVVDETWFSDPHFCEKSKHWYMAPKTLAVEAAWRFAKANGIDLVVLNPGFMFGPLLQPALNSTSEVVLGFTKGANAFPSSTYWLVDVRDVAYAHIQAFEIPSAAGRYCLVEQVVPFSEILKTLNQLYPTLGLQSKCEDHGKPVERIFKVSQEKATSLGVSFIPWEIGLREIIESLKEKGFLTI
ncbi:phenylacetaldehyde reductase-like, partial [Hibiscus syriacus]|uniref:phenylacetaldehyde reductase-like n=1 Tax=Hibiscus syriacus TaxID=106335 RepID=UPI001924872D